MARWTAVIINFNAGAHLARCVASVEADTSADVPEAVALYRRCGYRQIPAYGPYVGTPHSLCFGRSLASG